MEATKPFKHSRKRRLQGRRTPRARALIHELEHVHDLRWQRVGQSWEATESQLNLSGWSRPRRVVVVRRRLREARRPRAQRRQARQALPRKRSFVTG